MSKHFYGAVLMGALVNWQSDDSSVAVVDTTGAVVARGPGSAQITASLRDLHAVARVIVIQKPERLVLQSDTALRALEGDTLRLLAKALDARGHTVRNRAVRWQSGDLYHHRNELVLVQATPSDAAVQQATALMRRGEKIQAIKAVRERLGNDIPAIIVTGSSMIGHEEEARKHNFHILLKPVVPNKLRALIAFKLGVRGNT